MLTTVLAVLVITALVAWALASGLGRPRPQEQVEVVLDLLDLVSRERNLRALMIEQRIGMSVMRPERFVVVTSVT